MNKIIIYTNETCPYCKQVKEKLNENNIKFTERLTKDWKDKWQEIVNLTGIPTVPTIETENIYSPGRDFGSPEHLVNILNNQQPCKYSDSRQILEKIKTLNYNMGQAFQRTDQLLRQIENKLNIKE
jgi:glutaredoxin|tara:strand:+ start:682 stop:1059 length:378 start_codon:yes stop_codon:yes gene_type:complete